MAFGLDLGNLLIHLRGDESQFIRSMDKAEKKLRAVSDKLTAVGRKMTMRVTAPIVVMGGAVTKAFASFDDAMTKSLAIMGDVTPQMRKEMEELAISISKRSVTSATQLAKSYFYLASAGLSVEQSIAALATVERFAVAGAFDMALATDLVTDAQSALGLTVKDAQKNLENMTRVTDVLTGANTLANASTQQFSEALMRAGPAMKAYGIKVEEGTAVLAAYADQGKKAAMGGELFGRMLRLMIKGFIDNREVWDRFNISIEQTNGKLRPMADIVRDLTSLLSNMGVIQKATTLGMLGFQARSQQAIMPLLGMGDAIEVYNEQLIRMAGITKKIAEKQLMSFSSQMKILWNNVKATALEIGAVLAPVILRLNVYVLRATKFWASLNDSVKRSIIFYAGVAAAIGPVLLVTGLLFKALSLMVGVLGTLKVGFVVLGAAMSVPFLAAIGLAAVAYALRAAWVQNLNAIKDRMQDTLNAFDEGFNWLLSGPVGNTVKTFAKAWIDLFYFIGTNFDDFISDMAGTLAGTKTWLQKVKDGVLGIWDASSLKMAIAEWKDAWRGAGEGFASSFIKSKEKAEKAFNDFSESVVLGYKTTALTLGAFGEATVEHLKDLMTAVKIQFGEDADAIIGLIKSKIESLQKSTGAESLYGALVGADVGPLFREWESSLEPVVESIKEIAEVVPEITSEGTEMIKRMLRELDTEYKLLGLINEERERAIRLEKFREIVTKEHVGDLEKINELTGQYTEKLDKLISGKRGLAAFEVQMREWASEATNVYQSLGEVATQTFDDMARSLSNMLMRSKVDFKAFARSVVGDLLTITIRAQMARAAMSLFPGLFTAPVAAAVPATMPVQPMGVQGLVPAQGGGWFTRPTAVAIAEKEPELVTPLSQLRKMFGDQATEVRIYNEGSEKLEISEAESYMVSDQRIIDVTVKAAETSGPYRRSIKQAVR